MKTYGVCAAHLLTNHTGGDTLLLQFEMTSVSLTKKKEIARILSVMSSGINF